MPLPLTGPGVRREGLEQIERLLAPFHDAGFVTRVPWLLSAKYLPPSGMSWEDTLYQDCLHRVRGKADFVANPHLDEYFFPRGKFKTLTAVLLNAKERYAELGQVKLYEHPMLLHKTGTNNFMHGEPADMLKRMQNGTSKASDIPCGRNTQFSDDHLVVTATEHPFEAILNPLMWESWHAPGGAVYSDEAPRITHEYKRDGDSDLSVNGYSGIYADDSRKGIAESLNQWEAPSILLHSTKEATIFHASPHYRHHWFDGAGWKGKIWEHGCGYGFEGKGEAELNLLYKAGKWDADTWPISRAKAVALTPAFSQGMLDCVLGTLRAGSVSEECRRQHPRQLDNNAQ